MSQVPLPWHLTEVCIDAAYPLTGAGVTVALIDTGVDTTHPALAGRIVAAFECGGAGLVPIDHTKDHDFHGHGTRMAGLICADRVNGGVAPEARIVSLVYPQTAGGYPGMLAALRGLVRAIKTKLLSIGVVNLSLGLENLSAFRRQLIQGLIANLLSEQVLVVAAVGNEQPFQGMAVDCPADLPETIAVGATDQNHRVSGFSRSGSDLVAPGEGILTCQRGGGLMTVEGGTSHATAIVSGLVALYREWQPLTVDDLRNEIYANCVRLAGESSQRQGQGLIQVP